ncbi:MULTISPECIES: Fe-S cluster assembly protein SufD [unclassified Marinimicrobium]|jgi:Fe-S cluster assembly protein SufD|uniref:Fe-S cluster assembly protein SufD n=1 Tax=Marinimicrobium TaxID=359337 RepID=UPI000C661EA0|nr:MULTISPECIES: Fe-S cluster assembly protein SufD [unclassified Marinimicrobium]MAN50768.1 Fe-S cluster assembly protein SufD [Marinimicrobium sp.]
MSDFQQQALQLAGQQDSPDWLSELRTSGARQWLKTPWPNRKTEQWKYTPLAPLQKTEFAQWAESTAQWQDQIEWLELDATRLVFVNGVFDPEASDALPAEVVRFGDASAEQQAVIGQHLGKIVDSEHHLFAALSNAWASEDGVLVHVPKDTKLAKPLYVVQVSTPGSAPATANQRLLVVLETGAQASIIEHFASTDDEQNGFVNSLTEIEVGENAFLHHYRINLEEENLLHVGGIHANLQRSSQLRGFTVAQGSKLKRIDYQINHCGDGAHLDLQGVYVPRNKQLIDYHTNVQHKVPHCTSNEVFRGIIGDSAHAVFNGRIHIHQDAQKTLAELSNKNLLTSPKAEVDTKPELEIYADDVKCAHGATVSQLNKTALYYMQARGISREEAQVMLNFGFINELLQDVAEPAVRNYLGPRLARLFSSNSDLLRHIQSEEA